MGGRFFTALMKTAGRLLQSLGICLSGLSNAVEKRRLSDGRLVGYDLGKLTFYTPIHRYRISAQSTITH